MKDVIWVGMLVLIMLYIFGVLVTSFYADNHCASDHLWCASDKEVPKTLRRSDCHGIDQQMVCFDSSTMQEWISKTCLVLSPGRWQLFFRFAAIRL